MKYQTRYALDCRTTIMESLAIIHEFRQTNDAALVAFTKYGES